MVQQFLPVKLIPRDVRPVALEHRPRVDQALAQRSATGAAADEANQIVKQGPDDLVVAVTPGVEAIRPRLGSPPAQAADRTDDSRRLTQSANGTVPPRPPPISQAAVAWSARQIAHLPGAIRSQPGVEEIGMRRAHRQDAAAVEAQAARMADDSRGEIVGLAGGRVFGARSNRQTSWRQVSSAPARAHAGCLGSRISSGRPWARKLAVARRENCATLRAFR